MKSNPKNNTGEIPFSAGFRSANATRRQGLIQAITACLFLLALAPSSPAVNVNMTTGDGFGAHSFDSTGSWSPAIAPSPGNNYFSAFIVRSNPTATSNNVTFLGDSLTLSNGGALYQKVDPLVMTVNALTNMGRVVNAQAGSFTVLGNMFVPNNSSAFTNNFGGAMDHGSGNSSPNDSRTITNGMTISGPGALTNLTTDGNWVSGANAAAQGRIVYTGNNTGFTGPQIAIRNTIIQIGAEANLGGNPGTFNPAQLVLDLGILRPTASFALDYSNSGITIGANGGKFDLLSGILFTNSEALVGAGTLTVTNAGTLVCNGAATNFTGTLLVSNTTAILAAASALAGSNTIFVGAAGTLDATAAGMSLTNGQTLAGIGTVLGTVTSGSGSQISPAGAGTAGNLAIANLNLNNGAVIACDFLATNDIVVVSGNLTPSGTTSIKILSVPAVGTYPLITVAGTLGGSAANFHVAALSTRSKSFAVIYDTASTPKRVLLQVTSSGTPANLTWQGDGVNNLWDIATSTNWVNGLTNDVSYDSDTNNFTDFGATNQPVLNVTVNPGAVFFNSSSNYTLTGSGGIAGLTTLSQGGSGTVTISTTNTYSGGTLITNGVLRLGFTNAVGVLGSPSGATPLASVSGTGTLDINGAAVDNAYSSRTVQINGNGFSATQGAIDNTSGGLTSGTSDVGLPGLSLAGNSTVSANSNWQIGNSAVNGTGIAGNGFNLTKIGNSYLYLRHSAANPLGGFTIVGPGGVLFWDRPDAVGLTTPITLTNGGYIDTWNPANNFSGLTFYNPVVVNDPVNGGIIFSTRAPTFNHPGWDVYNGSVTLLGGSLTVSNGSVITSVSPNTFGRVTLNGNVSGPGGMVIQGGTTVALGTGSPEFFGGNLVFMNGNNSYSGPTMVTNLVWLYTSTANQSGGTYDVVDNATLDMAVAANRPTIPMSSLTVEQQNIGAGNLGFTRLTSMPASPVVYATNLTITAGVILPPLAGYSVGQFPLVKYNGTIGGAGFAGLALGTLPGGVTASLVDNAGNHTIDLSVSTAGFVWKGNVSSNWNLSTANWFNPISSSASAYSDGETVVFDDTATSFNVSIAQTVQPGGITVNAANNYNFGTAAGGVAGSAILIKNGSGTLTIASTNNTFTGGTYINGGTLVLADQNFVFPYGGGALNNNLGMVTIANGGTLDINGVQVPNFSSFAPDGYNVFVSGVGVGGNGALVNNNTADNDLADPGYVTLTGDATVGGTGDINIRMGVSPQLSSQSGDYTLTKAGTNQFRIRYLTTVSTNFGAINILGGRVTYESSSALGLGDPAKPIYVGNGGGFGWGTTSAPCVRPLICSNGAAIVALNITNNLFNSPVTLVSGNVNLSGNFYNGMIFSNTISGTGGLTLQFQSLATFAASNTYSGSTTVANANTAGGGFNGSLLKLIGNGSIEHSANISLQGVTASQAFPGALDVSGRTDGTLNLLNGQTLRGDNGSWIKGSVIANSGTRITPGGPTNIQFMTVSNNLTLQAGSTVAMDVSLDGGTTNDLIRVVGAMAYGGTLQITNIGATALTNGASFKLFNNGSFSGNFTTVSGSPGVWSFTPATGVATVSGLPTGRAIITHIGVSGTTLTLNATNGVANAPYVLLQSSNVVKPLALWAPALTNLFDSNGNVNLATNIINLGVPLQFYILSY